MPFSIARLGHVELRVTDIERAREFYVGLLGFVETERDSRRLYLRGYEERYHHSIALKEEASAGLSHFAFRVSSEEDLDSLESLFRSRDLPVVKLEKGEERGVGRAIRVQDPTGFPVEFYYEMKEVGSMLQRFHLYRGARPMRIDHVNCQTPNVALGHDFYVNQLGFKVSEYTVGRDGSLWGSWLFRKQNVHDIAIMRGTGPRLHHVGVWMPDAASVLWVCDILAGAGKQEMIERGPGRHGLSNAFFLYIRDQDGNRVEFYTGDYMTADPDWKPIKWSIEDRNRATFWGHVPPQSWFDEATPVESVLDGTLIKPVQVISDDRPSFVT